MRLKEKAKELFDKFHFQIINDNGLVESDSTKMCAKQCALICCKQMLIYVGHNHRLTLFWEAVKNEIKNL